MYSKQLPSTLLAASAQVCASTIAARQDPAYLSGLLWALNQANLTTLAAVLTHGPEPSKASQLPKRRPMATSSSSCLQMRCSSRSCEDCSGNSSTGLILSYRLLNTSYPADVSAAFDQRHLDQPGWTSQVPALEKVVAGRTIGNATVSSSMTHSNLITHVIDTAQSAS